MIHQLVHFLHFSSDHHIVDAVRDENVFQMFEHYVIFHLRNGQRGFRPYPSRPRYGLISP